MELLAAFLLLPLKKHRYGGEGHGNNPLIPPGTYPTYNSLLGGRGEETGEKDLNDRKGKGAFLFDFLLASLRQNTSILVPLLSEHLVWFSFLNLIIPTL